MDDHDCGCNTVDIHFWFTYMYRDDLFVKQDEKFSFFNWSCKIPPYDHSESWSKGTIADMIGDMSMWASDSCG